MPYPFGTIPAKLRALLFGTPFGEVWPIRNPPPPLSEDGRTTALKILQEYVTSLVFYVSAGQGKGPPKAFQIPPENFFIEYPDYVESLHMPCMVVVPDRATYDPIGLTAYVEENTRDVYSPGTVLQWQAEYTETINLEIWSPEIPVRRAILAALESALSPTEQMSGLRFRMPDYYNELVVFILNGRENMDDADSARKRRRAQVEIEMRFNIVALVNYVPMQPQVVVETDVDDEGLVLNLAPPTRDFDPPQPAGAEYVQPQDATGNANRVVYPGDAGPQDPPPRGHY